MIPVLILDGAVRKFPDGREVCLKSADGKREYRNRTLDMRTRQHSLCGLCGHWMTEEETTFEHDIPRGFNGAWRDDRIVNDKGQMMNCAAHKLCNGAKGSRRL